MLQIDRGKKKSRLESKGTDVPLCCSRSTLPWHLITTSHILTHYFITCTIKILNFSNMLSVLSITVIQRYTTLWKISEKGQKLHYLHFFKKLEHRICACKCRIYLQQNMKLCDLFGYSTTTSNPQISVLFYIWRTKAKKGFHCHCLNPFHLYCLNS